MEVKVLAQERNDLNATNRQREDPRGDLHIYSLEDLVPCKTVRGGPATIAMALHGLKFCRQSMNKTRMERVD